MRGAIFGALGSRLSTGILTGEFDRDLTRRSYLGRQVEASTILSFASRLQAGVIAWAISAALGLATVPLLDLVAISLSAACCPRSCCSSSSSDGPPQPGGRLQPRRRRRPDHHRDR
jgi:cation transporter-like permease